jgi:hypothetical protein
MNSARLRLGLLSSFVELWLSESHELLIAEGFDGIEAGGFPGRVDAEDDAD